MPILKQSLFLLFAALFLLPLSGCKSALQKNREEGVRLYNAGQYDQALVSLNAALKDNQADPVANAYAGMIEYRADHLQQAEYHFEMTLKLDPSNEDAKNGLTATLFKQGKADKALDELERASGLADQVDDPRGFKSVKPGYDKQIEERLFLGKVDDRIRIAKAYETLMGDYDNALIYYKKALDMHPSDAKEASILFSIGTMAERAKNTAMAKEYLAQAYRKNPSQPGLVEAMTRNNLPISEVIGNPK